MIPIKQTKFGGPDATPSEQGNCWAACIASITHIPLERFPVPLSMEWEPYWDSVVAFLRSRDYGIIRLVGDKGREVADSWDGHVIACGQSPNGDWDHCVVWRMGKLIHDPHPKGRGLVGQPKEFEMVVLV